MPIIFKGKFKIVDCEKKVSGQGNPYFVNEVRDLDNRQPLSMTIASSEPLTTADFEEGVCTIFSGVMYSMPAFRQERDPFADSEKG